MLQRLQRQQHALAPSVRLFAPVSAQVAAIANPLPWLVANPLWVNVPMSVVCSSFYNGYIEGKAHAQIKWQIANACRRSQPIVSPLGFLVVTWRLVFQWHKSEQGRLMAVLQQL